MKLSLWAYHFAISDRLVVALLLPSFSSCTLCHYRDHPPQVLSVLYLVLVAHVQAYSNGKVTEACHTMKPQHGNPSQPSVIPTLSTHQVSAPQVLANLIFIQLFPSHSMLKTS
uniref:Secreted protein n=1 Tax=Eptatretus burgeri TaxID=7764 RepID=A0A8C4NFA9_EPTBU